ncbi:hypothetical protein F0U44_04230 [Nocardioides humilatus]|uniref:Heavy-metal-associated domain-containing protein n=1 Tax=Nocardioides humilatus TaxID=2607660 RepID=A0A5B1LL58_9ACTN|nr:hypothetical protein [Nocardioides humilatus]KAA1421505.1 hypothetical protein F0U44_04230 [Nocardioides humilatus]
MKVWQRVLAYLAALALVLVAAIGIGRALGPISGSDEGGGHGVSHDEASADDHGAHDGHGDHDETPTPAGAYQLVVADTLLAPGRRRVAFTIYGETGKPLTAYDVQHEKELHLIAVRADLAEFRHVHPTRDTTTGEWSVPVALSAGPWRIYADFVPAGGEQTVLTGDVSVSGDYTPAAVGSDRLVSRVAGYQVGLETTDGMVTARVTRGGRDVTDLEPYLGAYGHLVVIRAGDLAYLHVHPEDGAPGPEVAFHSELADAGTYRLFLDFKHGGKVHTADFTLTVDGS